MNLLSFLRAKWLPRRASNAPLSTSGLMSQTRINVSDVTGAVSASEQGNPRLLFRIYRDLMTDSHLQGEFSKRLLAALGDPMTAKPVREGHPDDMAAAAAVIEMMDQCENWTDALKHLMRSTLWPVAVAEKIYAPAPPSLAHRMGEGRGEYPPLRYILKRLEPVDDSTFDLRRRAPIETRDQWEPCLQLFDVDDAGYMAVNTTRLDPLRHLVHRGHLLTSPDSWGGPARALLFWWLLGNMDREWWAQFLEKYGTPFPVGKTNASDSASVSLLESAFASAKKLGGLVIDHEDEVELIEASKSDAGQAFSAFKEFANREISKLIIGQDLSASSAPTGLGSGVANLQGTVRSDIRQWDQRVLLATLERQLIPQFLLVNGLPGKVKLILGAEETADAKTTADVVNVLKQAGLEPTDESITLLSDRVGFALRRSVVAPPIASPSPLGGERAGVRAFSASRVPDDVDRIAANRAAALGKTYHGAFAPIRVAIISAHSTEEARANLAKFFPDWNPARLTAELEDALQVCAAAGAGFQRNEVEKR